jgi:hypothetical protein
MKNNITGEKIMLIADSMSESIRTAIAMAGVGRISMLHEHYAAFENHCRSLELVKQSDWEIAEQKFISQFNPDDQIQSLSKLFGVSIESLGEPEKQSDKKKIKTPFYKKRDRLKKWE